MPVVLAGTLRPNEPGTDLGRDRRARLRPADGVVHPQPLSADGSAGALRARLGETATDGVLREGHDVTGGNPLLLSELARTLEVEGPARQDPRSPATSPRSAPEPSPAPSRCAWPARARSRAASLRQPPCSARRRS